MELRERQGFTLAGRTEFLPGRVRAFHLIVKPHLRQHPLQIFDMHFRGKPLTAAFAKCRLSRFSSRLIKLHAQLRGALKNMKELSEREIKQRRDHGNGVENGQETVGFTPQPTLRNSQRQTGDRNCEQQNDGKEIKREGLHCLRARSRNLRHNERPMPTSTRIADISRP